MKKWIIFDVDDVVASYRESLYQSFKKKGKDIHWSKWNTYKHVKIYGLENYDTFLEYMRNEKIIENAPIEDGVSDLIHKLKSEGFSIGFLTARSWHEKAQEVTQEFADKYNLPIDKIVIAGFKGKKTDYIKDFDGEIIGFLDDSAGHVEDFINAGISNSYVMDRPWNQEYKTNPRIKHYEEFYNKIMENESKKVIKMKIK